MIAKCNTQKYCCEDISKIENYKEAMADTERVWFLHHRLEALATMNDLIEMGMYYNRPAMELIFTNNNDHNKLPHLGKKVTGVKVSKALKGRHRSEEVRKKMSEARAGLPHPWQVGDNNVAKRDDVRKKISESKKGDNNPSKRKDVRKKMSEAKKGRHWKLVDGKRVWY